MEREPEFRLLNRHCLVSKWFPWPQLGWQEPVQCWHLWDLLESGCCGGAYNRRWVRGILLGRLFTLWVMTFCFSGLALLASISAGHGPIQWFFVTAPWLLCLWGCRRTLCNYGCGEPTPFLHDRTVGLVALALAATGVGALLAFQGLCGNLS